MISDRCLRRGALALALLLAGAGPASARGLSREQVRRVWLHGAPVGCLISYEDLAAFNVCVLELGRQLVVLRNPRIRPTDVNDRSGLWNVHSPAELTRVCPGLRDYRLLACVGRVRVEAEAGRRLSSLSPAARQVLEWTRDLPPPESAAAYDRLNWWDYSGKDEPRPERSPENHKTEGMQQ